MAQAIKFIGSTVERSVWPNTLMCFQKSISFSLSNGMFYLGYKNEF